MQRRPSRQRLLQSRSGGACGSRFVRGFGRPAGRPGSHSAIDRCVEVETTKSHSWEAPLQRDRPRSGSSRDKTTARAPCEGEIMMRRSQRAMAITAIASLSAHGKQEGLAGARPVGPIDLARRFYRAVWCIAGWWLDPPAISSPGSLPPAPRSSPARRWIGFLARQV
jgi:hypothetical protein